RPQPPHPRNRKQHAACGVAQSSVDLQWMPRCRGDAACARRSVAAVAAGASIGTSVGTAAWFSPLLRSIRSTNDRVAAKDARFSGHTTDLGHAGTLLLLRPIRGEPLTYESGSSGAIHKKKM